MLTAAEAAALFDRRRRAWLAEDLEGYLACFAADLVFQAPNSSEPLLGREAFAALVQRSFQNLRPLSFEFRQLMAEDDVVLAEWRIEVERRADGRRLGWDGMSVCRIVGGEIQSWREYWNPRDLADQ